MPRRVSAAFNQATASASGFQPGYQGFSASGRNWKLAGNRPLLEDGERMLLRHRKIRVPPVWLTRLQDDSSGPQFAGLSFVICVTPFSILYRTRRIRVRHLEYCQCA